MATLMRQLVGVHVVMAIAVAAGQEVLLAQCPTPPASHDCKCNGDNSEWVCASWDGVGTPQEGTDFTVSFGGGDPDVTLFTGDAEWKIYAEETASPNDLISIGDITLDPTAAEADFGVSVMRGSGAGAVNVGEVNLIDSDPETGPTWTGGSNIVSLVTTGNVTGTVKTVKDSGGAEGDLGTVDIAGNLSSTLVTIAGDATGTIDIDGTFSSTAALIAGDFLGGEINIGTIAGGATFQVVGNGGTGEHVMDATITTISDNGTFRVLGDLAGDITVSTLAGTLQVDGGADSHSYVVTITNFSGDGSVIINGFWFVGVLDLTNGIDSADASATVAYLTGDIDLNGKDVLGTLNVGASQDSGDIVNGGAVKSTGSVGLGTISTPCFRYYRGSATFKSVDCVTTPALTCGNISSYGSNVMQGRLTIGSVTTNGDVAGTMSFSGAVEPYDQDACEAVCNPGQQAEHCPSTCGECTGAIVVHGNVTGDGLIDFSGGLAGSLDVNGDVDGDLASDADVSGDIDMEGFNGTIAFDQDLSGDLTITGAYNGITDVGGELRGDITVSGAMTNNSRITVDGETTGDVLIGTSTSSGSRIHLAGGAASTSLVVINNSAGNFDANGQIVVGSLSGDAVEADNDGSIVVKDNTGDSCSGSGGDLEGRIRIAVCDDDTNDHDICIDGDVNGTIDIIESFGGGQCSNNGLSYSCGLGCQ